MLPVRNKDKFYKQIKKKSWDRIMEKLKNILVLPFLLFLIQYYRFFNIPVKMNFSPLPGQAAASQ